MSLHIQIALALLMIILYVAIFRGLQISSSSLDRQLFYSFGIGIFSALLLIFWIFQYSTYNTIIYWRIIELFK